MYTRYVPSCDSMRLRPPAAQTIVCEGGSLRPSTRLFYLPSRNLVLMTVGARKTASAAQY